MKTKIKYYLIKDKGSEHSWISITQDGVLIKEYNRLFKKDTTCFISDKGKIDYIKRLIPLSNFECKEISKKEAFLILL